MKYINHEKKLNSIKLQKNNFYVLIDFDRTITRAKSISAWRVLYYSDLLGGNFREKYTEIHDKTELNENETNEAKQKAFEKRFATYMNLLKECHFNKDILKKAVEKTDLKLREGAKDFLKKMHENNIPVIIISSSLKNVIEEYLRQQNAYFDNIYIYANYYDMNGVEEKNVTNITPYNKNKIEFSEELKKCIQGKENILLLGDIINDINMVSSKTLNRTITVGFLENDIEKNLEAYRQNFDIVLTNQASFKEVFELIDFK